MRTFEEIIEAAESIMAAIEATLRKKHGKDFIEFHEITIDDDPDRLREIVMYSGKRNRHQLFANVAFFSRRFLEIGDQDRDYGTILFYLRGDGSFADTVDSTDNPGAWEHATLYTPIEIDILLDWVERMYRTQVILQPGMWDYPTEFDLPIAHLRKIRAYTKSEWQKYWEARAE